jgi:ribosomal-protein-alanine N-acetyltransferase
MMVMDVDRPVIITTERLTLRPFRDDDWKAVHEYALDPEISKYQEWGPNSAKDTKLFVSKCIQSTNSHKGNIFFFSITLKPSDTHIGGCVLTAEKSEPGEASIGYTIARSYWKNGYASEAANALLELAFTNLGLTRVTANCDSENIGSWRVMEKVGMRFVDTQLNSRYFKGSWRDWREYAISGGEWFANRRQDKNS